MARPRLTQSEMYFWILRARNGPAARVPSIRLIERLLRRKLIRSKLCLTGKRRGHQISLTTTGSRVLGLWLPLPIPDRVAEGPPDPLRTRGRCLGAIVPNQRTAFLQ